MRFNVFVATTLALIPFVVSAPSPNPQPDSLVERVSISYPNITVRAPSSFVHPGVLLNTAQLNFIRDKVNSGAEPWSTAYSSMLSSSLASLSRSPSPYATVECGSYSNPNNGCTEERQDALAAYSMALAWYITQDAKYAKKAVEYFNAWSPVIKSHTNSNAPLQTGWSGTSWARAAEIIRYTYNGKSHYS
jgi:hypothetical protein